MISVIVPVYNGEKYIERNFSSIKNQTFKDFEVIYVNDGSQDSSLQILNNIQNEKNNFTVKVINQENGGVSTARNTGINNSKGEYICFVDVDDEIAVDYLSYMYELITKHNADLVFCGINKDNKYRNANKIVETLYSKQQALENFLYRKISIGVWSMLCKVELFENNRFADGYKYSEDIHMVWRLFNNCQKIVGTNKKLYIYYSCPNSAMSRFDEQRLHGIELMTHLEDYFEKTNPNFSVLYKKFAVARLYWSIIWQAALKLNRKDYIEFAKKLHIKSYFKKLIGFKSIRVSVSSILGLISLNLFRILANLIAKDLVH